MKDVIKKESFIELRAKGLSFAKISNEIKISKPTLIKWSREFEIEISNMKALELEALREQYGLIKQKRLESLKNTLSKLQKELNKRNFEDISTEKLIHLNIQITKETEKEEGPLVLSEKIDTLRNIDISKVESWKS